MLGTYWLESSSAENDLEVSVGNKLIMNQQSTLAVKAATIILGCMNRTAASRSGEAILL